MKIQQKHSIYVIISVGTKAWLTSADVPVCNFRVKPLL